MFGWGLVPGVLLGIGMFLLPDRPRSLVNGGREDDAREVIARIEGKSAEEAEEGETVRTQEIEEALRREKELEARVGWAELLHRDMRITLAVGIRPAVLQQFVGINTVIYYASTIFKYAGYSSNAIAILGTVGVGAVNVSMTIAAIFLLDRLGRVPLPYADLHLPPSWSHGYTSPSRLDLRADRPHGRGLHLLPGAGGKGTDLRTDRGPVDQIARAAISALPFRTGAASARRH